MEHSGTGEQPVFAFYQFPEPDGTRYYQSDFMLREMVELIFDYCQIWLAYITRDGWTFLLHHYGYEVLYEINGKSGWLDCETLEEFESAVRSKLELVE